MQAQNMECVYTRYAGRRDESILACKHINKNKFTDLIRCIIPQKIVQQLKAILDSDTNE